MTEYDKHLKKCPNCGGKTPRSKAVYFIIALIVIICGATFLGDKFSFSDLDDPYNKKIYLNLEPGYQLINVNNIYYVEGNVSNDSSKDFDYIEIIFDALDENNEIIGKCSDNHYYLQANSKWKFKATCDNNNVKNVNINSINPK